jgi:hypothetical protein
LATLAPSGADFTFSRFIGRAFSPRADIEAGDCDVLVLSEVAEDCWRKRGFPDPFNLIGDLDFDITWVWDRIQDPRQNSDGSSPDQDDFRTMFGPGFSF